MQNLVASWIVFIVLGGISGALRYGGLLSGGDLSMMIEYGKWVVLALYLMIVLAAFKDTVFQGILSLLVPFYGFYWLFMVSDQFMARAVVGGLLVGLGQDFGMWFNETALGVIENVNGWIMKGG